MGLKELLELFGIYGIEYKLDASEEEVEESIESIREACDDFLKG